MSGFLGGRPHGGPVEGRTSPLLAWPSEPGEIARRIDRRRSLAQFEVELRRIDVAGVAGLGDHLPALDRFAPLHIEFAVVAVSRDEAVRMLDEDEVAVTFKPVARVDDSAALRRPNRGSGGTEMLMPSLPPALNPWMMRPRAGQRNSGSVPAASACAPVSGTFDCAAPEFKVARRRLIDRRLFGLRRLGWLALGDGWRP